ncbi:MAG: SAM-dependent methyltransferase [Chitinophagaceae bacterium]|nr:MAG: SAM-dependent methyltransferase [Chitinophagaceae bacterium]
MKPFSFTGKLYLIPTTLGESEITDVLPATISRAIDFIFDFIVENEKTARKFIKQVNPDKKQADLRLHLLNKRTEPADLDAMIQPMLDGRNVGLMSEAGCPGVADPGAAIVKLAHENGIQVIPLVGPSSILLALMASGMNGQQFAFNGYLPIDKSDKKAALRQFEKISSEKDQSQIFIETPYRNNKLVEDLLVMLQPDTRLCIAADITLPSEYIRTLKVSQWKKEKVDLQNRPAIFILHRP